MKFTVLFLLGVGCASAVSADSYMQINRPVNKVIALLRDMQSQLEKDADEDKEVYEKMACWCETNEKAKTQAIEDAETRISQLESAMEGMGANNDRLIKEIAALEKEIAKNEQSLAQATRIREKEQQEFGGEKGDLAESIASLKAAIAVLSKHHTEPEALLHVSSVLKHQMKKHSDVLSGESQRKIGVFLQLRAEGNVDAYAPQSGEIFGILQQMLESFQANLAAAEKEEGEAQAQYDDLKAAKTGEVQAGKQELDEKKQQLAKIDENGAQNKQDLEDTKAQLEADKTFLDDLKERCSMTDDEWEERQKGRQEEMEAISMALSILTSDDAHDLFVKTFNPAEFVQQKKVSHSSRRAQAAAILRRVAHKQNDAALMQVVSSLRLDSFDRVKKAIDEMVAQLKAEQKDEQKHRDWCNDERNQNDAETKSKDDEKARLLASIDELGQAFKTYDAAIKSLQREVSDAQIAIKQAGQEREAQNREFQTTVSDQRATQAVLTKALQVLQKFYNKALLQLAGPPEGFKKYEKKSGGATGAIGLLQSIIADAQRMEKEAVQAERDSQAAYETFVKDTNAEISAAQRDMTNKQEDKAKAEQDQVAAKEGLEGVMEELEQLTEYSASLHQSCDYITKNFETRQTARNEEIEALVQAKAILSGASFAGASFLRRA